MGTDHLLPHRNILLAAVTHLMTGDAEESLPLSPLSSAPRHPAGRGGGRAATELPALPWMAKPCSSNTPKAERLPDCRLLLHQAAVCRSRR